MAKDTNFTITFDDQITAVKSTIGDINSLNTNSINNQIKRDIYDIVSDAIYPTKSTPVTKTTNEPRTKNQELRDKFLIHQAIDAAFEKVSGIKTTQKKSSANTANAVVPYSPKEVSTISESIGKAVLNELGPLLKRSNLPSTVEFDSGGLKKELVAQIAALIKEHAPRESANAIKTMVGSLADIKDTMVDLKGDFGKLVDIRRNGVENIGEVKELYNVVTRIFEGLKHIVKNPGTEGLQAAKSLPTAARNDVAKVNEKVSAVKSGAKAQATKILNDFRSVPKEMLQATIDDFIAKVNKAAPSYSDSKFMKTLESFSGKGLDDLATVISALEKTIDTLPKNISMSKDSLKDTGKFLDALRELSSVVRSLSTIKDPRQGNTNWNKLSKVSSVLEDTTQKAVVNLEIEYDKADKQLVKWASKQTTVPVVAQIVSKQGDIQKQIQSTAGKSVINVTPELTGSLSAPPPGRDKAMSSIGFTTSFADFSQDFLNAVKRLESLMSSGDSDYQRYLGSLINKLYKVASDSSGGDIVDLRKALSSELDLKSNKAVEFYKDKASSSVDRVLRDLRESVVSGRPDEPITITVTQPVPKHGTVPASPSAGTTAPTSPKTVTIPTKEQHVKIHTTTEPDSVITPGKLAPKDYEITKRLSNQDKAIDDVAQDLRSSLLDLQQSIVQNLDASLSKSKGWDIVRKGKDQPVTEYFTRASGYNQKTSGKQYVLTIADIETMRKETNLTSKEARSSYSAEAVMSEYKNKIKEELVQRNEGNPGVIVNELGKWLQRTPAESVETWKGLNKSQTAMLSILKKQAGGGTAPSETVLNSLSEMGADIIKPIYKQTIGEMYADKVLQDQKRVRKLTVPAATQLSSGANVFSTAQGSQRIIPKFAVYKTGFENMYEKLTANNKDYDASTNTYATDIKKLGLKPGTEQQKDARDLSGKMMKDLAGRGTAYREFIVSQYDEAAALSGARATKLKHVESPSVITDAATAAKQQFGGAFISMGSNAAMNNFVDAMNKAGVTTYDFVKSMESLNFENIYDLMNKVLTSSAESSPVGKLGALPNYDRNIRGYEEAMGDLVGTIPIADPARPRRYTHQGSVVNVRTMTSSPFAGSGGGTLKFTADQQKEFIRDMNTTMSSYLEDTATLTKAGLGKARSNVPLDVRTISSLGVPESQAAAITELRPGGRVFNEEGEKGNVANLNALRSTSLKMYSDDLTELMPFGQFQQRGRNIASTTNAIKFVPQGYGGLQTSTPLLQSARENDLIGAGRYGHEGYGFNVTAELRNTASTFEDQIVISGQLADVLTSAVKTIVQPDKLGALDVLTQGGNFSESGEGKVSDIEPQGLTKGARSLREDFDKIDRIFQNVLGVDQKYKGRADEALIKEVSKVITVNRGKEMNVQMAEIAETFFNYYGRKFTTRAGSKGVAISPTGGEMLTGKQLNEMFGDKKVKFLSEEERKTAGLGSAITPKSMGALLSEILKAELKTGGKASVVSKEEVDTTSSMLKQSGNKFLLSMFTDTKLGLTPGKQANEQQKVFENAAVVFEKLGIKLEKDVAGIQAVQKAYGALVPDGKAYKETPIDMRISAYGAAKRGLQTENLETILNNIASTESSAAPAVVNTAFDKNVYQRFLGDTEGDPLSFSRISEALGYTSGIKKDAGTEEVKAIKDSLRETLKTRKFKGSSEELEAKVQQLFDLEQKSNYYTDVVSEFGEKRKSLVGPKFVEVVENPHQYAPWTKGDINNQQRGEKLNLAAYGAYSSIFGENSKFMEDLSGDIPLDSKKHWEYMKSLQTMNPMRKEATDLLFKSAPVVNVSDMRDFKESTGKFIPRAELEAYEKMSPEDRATSTIRPNEILNDTILDTVKYPGAINLQIPSTINPKETEPFYVPSAVARTTYAEPTHAGHRGLDAVSRRLQILVNAAKEVDDVVKIAPKQEEALRGMSIGRIVDHMGGVRKESERTNSLPDLEKIFDRLTGILSKGSLMDASGNVDTRMTYNQSHYKNDQGQFMPFETRADYLKDLLKRKKVDYKGDDVKAYRYAISQGVDQVIGPFGQPTDSKHASRFEKDAPMFGSLKEAGTLQEIQTFSKNVLDIKPPTNEDELKKAVASLERAKIDYYNTLANTVMGKTGSVQELLFTRKVPAVMAKAVSAVVDKTEDFQNFEKELHSIYKDLNAFEGGDEVKALFEAASNMGKVSEGHAKSVAKYREKGMPVLKQHELGVSEEYAEVLPAEFRKTFELNEKTGKLGRFSGTGPLPKGETLADLLNYREMLETNKGQFSEGSLERKDVENELANKVQPYIESIRFPFTGVSSVQPYEAKLIKEEQYGGLAKHALIAPGIPEMDFAAFDGIKKSVESTMNALGKARSEEYKEVNPDYERIKNLTDTINRLDAAMAKVIPMYIAQQQKLDYDGDQIEIHSAKTSKAREEIEQHYKSLTEYDLSKGTTEQAFRREFTYGAMVPSTGEYTLAEQQLAFEKKFPVSEGFEFLKKPFLTKELDYLSSKEQLNVLAGAPGTAGGTKGPRAALLEVIPEVFRNEDTASDITTLLMNVAEPTKVKDGETVRDDDAFADALLAALKTQGDNISKPIEEGLREMVYNTKQGNAINAQLFKINTGRDTESLNRLLKIFERNVGMGSGLINKDREYTMSTAVSQRYPEGLKSVGGPIGGELTTMMNEIIRVGIQKGLDVKHAGEVPIATEMAKLISQGPQGITRLTGKINKKEGAYSDLKDFSEANEKTLRFNMGGMSTEDLYSDALKIAKGRGGSAQDVSSKGREELENYIVENIGFEGFLKELGQQVRDAAYEGLKRDLLKMDEGALAKTLKGMDLDDFVTTEIGKQMTGEGVNVLKTAEAPLMPLYGFRTSTANTHGQLKQFENKYGKREHPDVHTALGGGKSADEYVNKLRAIEATAANLSDALYDTGRLDKVRGSYDKLAVSTVEALRRGQEVAYGLASSANEETAQLGKDITSTDALDRITGKEYLGKFAEDVLDKPTTKKRSAYLEDYAKMVGAPVMSQERRKELEGEYSSRAGVLANEQASAEEAGMRRTWTVDERDARVNTLTKDYTDKAIAVEQSDVIVKVAQASASSLGYLDKIMPSSEVVRSDKEYYDEQRHRLRFEKEQQRGVYRAKYIESATQSAENEAFQYVPAEGAAAYIPPTGGGSGSGGSGGSGMSQMSMSGAVVPVHLLSIEPELYPLFGGGKGPVTGIKTAEAVTKHAEELKRVDELIEKITGVSSGPRPNNFGERYIASGLKGGQKDFESQVDAIKKIMMGIDFEGADSPIFKASSPLGTAIHAKLEDKYRERPNTEIEKAIKYTDTEQGAGKISGIVDVLNLKDDMKSIESVIDVKTISQNNYNALKKIVTEIMGDAGKAMNVSELTPEIMKKAGIRSEHFRENKMGDVASQLNFYLKALEEQDPDATKAPAYAHFYNNLDETMEPIKIRFDFDQDRLNKDMQAVKEAKARAEKELGGFPKPTERQKSPLAGTITPEEIDELIEITRRHYSDAVAGNGSSFSGSSASRGGSFRGQYANVSAGMKAKQAETATNPFEDTMDGTDYSKASLATRHGALRQVHSLAREHHRERGISIDSDGIDTFNEGIKDVLTKTTTSGPAGSEMSNVLTRLSKEGTITQSEVSKAWKAYRIAVGDYYVKKLDDSLNFLRSQESGSPAEVNASNAYENLINKFQNTVRGSAFKKSDIYTDGGEYLNTREAKMADVWISFEERHRRATDPLDSGDTEDTKLKDIFTHISKLDKDDTPRDAVGYALQQLMGLDKNLIDIYTDKDKVAKAGPEMFKDWDFSALKQGISRLRAAMERKMSFGAEEIYDSAQLVSMKEVLKELRALEKLYINVDFSKMHTTGAEGSIDFPALVDVPKQLTRNQQEAMHLRNVEQLRDYFSTPQDKGGPKKGDAYSYDAKVFGPNNRMLDKERYTFFKKADVYDKDSGDMVGKFSEEYKNLNEIVALGNRTFAVAIERVIKWGAAASVVYGGMRYLKESVGYISDVEVAMARLQMVMNPLKTNFDTMQKSAITFAKSYGSSIDGVLSSMLVFAQQGLSQQEVIDRAQTSTVAANITDLSPTDATEALTAAMKVFRVEGEGSMRFLDAWSEVEAKAAIKAGDLADAIKKSASAAKNAGFTFDQLNGMVAAIGSVTRQTGKEVGTSLRFIFNRLSSEKGPAALSKVGINTMDQSGQLRGGFDVLSDLQSKWGAQSRASKLNLAQSLGGTRQYNTVLTLMDNWDEVLNSVTNSINSKGSAEQRNLVLMKTYAKQLEVVKATMGELKIEVGKLVLPSFKTGLSGIKVFLELINDIPSGLKLAAAAAVTFFSFMAKGSGVLTGLSESLTVGASNIKDLVNVFKTNTKVSMYELFGMGDAKKDTDLFGLDTLKGGAKFKDLHGPLSQIGYAVVEAGKKFNSFLGIVTGDSSAAIEKVGGFISTIAGMIKKLASLLGLGATAFGFPEVGEIINKVGDWVTTPAQAVGKGMSKLGPVGKGAADYMQTNMTADTASAVKTLGPMIGTSIAGAMMAPSLWKVGKRLAGSADSYKDSQLALSDVRVEDLKNVNNVLSAYRTVEKQETTVSEAPIDDERNSSLYRRQVGLYKSKNKFKEMAAGYDAGLVSGYDERGNVVLNRSGGALKDYLKNRSAANQFSLALTKTDVASKYASEATETGGIQNWKYALKELASAAPLGGEMLGGLVNVGPKKALTEIQTQLNTLLSARNKNPFSNAFDKAIEELQSTQIKLKAALDVDVKQISDLLDSVITDDLTTHQIDLIVNQESLKEAYEAIAVTVDKYKLAGVTPNEVKAKYSMGYAFSGYKQALEPTAALTFDKLQEMGVTPRAALSNGKTPVTTGDLVRVTDTFAKKYAITGSQAVVGKDASGEIMLSFVSALTGELKSIKGLTGKELSGNVTAVASMSDISRSIDKSLTNLTTFTVGASAGMEGLDKKTLTKRQVALGERFYSDISSEVLLQTSKGYDRLTDTYGTPTYKQTYEDEFIKSFYTPMQQYSTMLESIKADEAEPDEKLSGKFGDELKDLQLLLQNNSVVFQFRMAFEDLNKSLENSQHTLRTTIELEKEHYNTRKLSSGFMSNIPTGLDGFATDAANFRDLSDKQRTLLDFNGTQDIAKNISIAEKTFSELSGQLDSVIKTKMDLGRIDTTSAGFSNRFKTQEEFNKYREIEGYTNDSGATEIVLAMNASTDQLISANSELSEIKLGIINLADLFRSPEERTAIAIKEVTDSATKAKNDGGFYKTLGSMDRVRALQEEMTRRNPDGEAAPYIGKLDEALNSASVTLLKKYDLKTLSKSPDVIARGLTAQGISPDDLVDRMSAAAQNRYHKTDVYSDFEQKFLATPGTFSGGKISPESDLPDELSALRRSLEKGKVEKGFFNVDTVGKSATAMAIYSQLKNTTTSEDIERLTAKIVSKTAEREELRGRDLPTTKVDAELKALKETKKETLGTKQFYTAAQGLATTTGLSYIGSKAFGASDNNTAKIVLTAAALKVMMEKMMPGIKEKAPEYYKKFEEKTGRVFDKVSEAIANDEPIDLKEVLKERGPKAANYAKEASREFINSFVEATKAKAEKFTGKSTEAAREDLKKNVDLQATQSRKEVEVNKAKIREEISASGNNFGRNAMAAMLAAVLTTVITDATNNLDTESNITTSTNLAADQQKAMMNLFKAAPEEFATIVGELSSQKQFKEDFGMAGEPIYGKSAALSIEEERGVKDVELQAAANKIKIELEATAAVIREGKEKLTQALALEQFFTKFTNIQRTLISTLTSSKIQQTFKAPSAVGDTLIGFAGGIAPSLRTQDMSATQRMYAEGDDSFKNVLNNYNKLSATRDSGVQMLGELAVSMQTAKENKVAAEASGDESGVKRYTEDLAELRGAYNAIAEKTMQASNALGSAANGIRVITNYQEALTRLQSSLDSSKVDRLVRSYAGLGTYIDNTAKMLGGSHPDANVYISPEQQRLAAKNHMTLDPNTATKYDVQLLNLRDQLSTTKDPQARSKILTQISDMPSTRKAEIADMQQKRYDQTTQGMLKPFEAMYTDVARIRYTNPDITAEQDKVLSSMSSILKRGLEGSLERVPIAQRIGELEATRSGTKQDSQERRLIDEQLAELKNWQQNPDESPAYVYKGIGLKDQQTLFEGKDKLASLFTGEEGAILNSAVTAPLAKELQIIASYLEAMADKTGVDVSAIKEKYGIEDPSIITKLIGGIRSLSSSGKPEDHAKAIGYNTGGARKAFSSTNPAESNLPVTGPGSSRGDKLITALSPGEFVIRAHTAQQIGYANLDYMNKKGELPSSIMMAAADGGAIPAFAGGGFVGDVTNEGKGFRHFSENLDSIIGSSEAARLTSINNDGMSIKNLFKQASLAKTELAAYLTKIPLSLFSGVEGASAYLANKGVSGLMTDVGNIKDGVSDQIKSEGFMPFMQGIGAGAISSITDSLKNGGISITAGIIESLLPGAKGLSKLGELSEVNKLQPNGLLSILNNQVGSIDNPAMVVKDLVSKPKPGRKFPSLYDNFSPMKKNVNHSTNYNTSMLKIDEFNRAYTDKYGVDFGFSRENFLPRQYLPSIGQNIDSFMSRYPELQDYLMFVGSKEFSDSMPVEDIVGLASASIDSSGTRGKHASFNTKYGKAGAIHISNENAIKKPLLRAKEFNLPLQDVSDVTEEKLGATLRHEFSHAVDMSTVDDKRRAHIDEIKSLLELVSTDKINDPYIASHKIGTKSRAKERFADFGSKFEKPMTDPSYINEPTMFDMSPREAIDKAYGTNFSTMSDEDILSAKSILKSSAEGEADVRSFFPKLNSGGVVGFADGGVVGKSWLETIKEESAQWEKANYSGKAAKNVDPMKVRSFTNIDPNGQLLSDVVEIVDGKKIPVPMWGTNNPGVSSPGSEMADISKEHLYGQPRLKTSTGVNNKMTAALYNQFTTGGSPSAYDDPNRLIAGDDRDLWGHESSVDAMMEQAAQAKKTAAKRGIMANERQIAFSTRLKDLAATTTTVSIPKGITEDLNDPKFGAENRPKFEPKSANTKNVFPSDLGLATIPGQVTVDNVTRSRTPADLGIKTFNDLSPDKIPAPGELPSHIRDYLVWSTMAKEAMDYKGIKLDDLRGIDLSKKDSELASQYPGKDSALKIHMARMVPMINSFLEVAGEPNTNLFKDDRLYKKVKTSHYDTAIGTAGPWDNWEAVQGEVQSDGTLKRLPSNDTKAGDKTKPKTDFWGYKLPNDAGYLSTKFEEEKTTSYLDKIKNYALGEEVNAILKEKDSGEAISVGSSPNEPSYDQLSSKSSHDGAVSEVTGLKVKNTANRDYFESKKRPSSRILEWLAGLDIGGSQAAAYNSAISLAASIAFPQTKDGVELEKRVASVLPQLHNIPGLTDEEAARAFASYGLPAPGSVMPMFGDNKKAAGGIISTNNNSLPKYLGGIDYAHGGLVQLHNGEAVLTDDEKKKFDELKKNPLMFTHTVDALPTAMPSALPSMPSTSASLSREVTVQVDAEALLQKLAAIELKVEDKRFEVADKTFALQDKIFSVEDKVFEVKDKIFTIENKVFEVQDKVFDVVDKKFEVQDKVFEVQDKVFTIEDKVFTIEDKKFEVQDKVFTVADKIFEATLKDATITVDVGEASTQLGNSLTSIVSQLTSNIGTTLRDINVTVDVSGAASQLSEAIRTAAASAKFNLPPITATTPDSAGSAALDKVTEMVTEVHDKLITVKGDLDGNVQVLGTRVENLGQEVQNQLMLGLAQHFVEVQNEINAVYLKIDSLSDNVTSQINRVDADGQETSRLARQALNYIS